MSTLFRRISRGFLDNRLARNLAWMAGTQMSNRLLRIITTITAARLLGPEVFGLAALVLATNEMVHVLSHGGISGKLIQASKHEVTGLSDSGYWLNWILCGSLTLLQIGAAYPIALFYDNPDLLLPIICLAFSYLLLPCGTIQAALLIRENRLKDIAKVDMSQSLADTLLTLILLLAGFGLWALVLPKLLVVPIWVIQVRRYHPWRITTTPTLRGWRTIVSFGKHLLWIDLLAALRNNIDYLIIGRFFGVEALGIYYFAFNAGLGISQGLLRAATTSLYPHLCELSQQTEQLLKRALRSTALIAIVLVPLILLQAIAAPYYVPIVFGEQWLERGAMPLLTLLCLSAIPRIVTESCSQLLRACNRPAADSRAQNLFTLGYIGALLLATNGDLINIAIAVLVSQLVFAPCFVLWCHQLLRQHSFMQNPLLEKL
ncbi:lipopolysaccharide biosynthesis protein [Amphritea sp. 1_MG-2023]|uniref:lipopolysaccharide biosynthesis protein n=1 Tax=Amphritea sp. 1_MG-2023 TaxID=3062670 RepID=UPI0026E41525|nr:lipopolysaccharide biosynthesis protein [Amphritea sp. 1_MG-2023]MDO6563773.1 lipopolysaccharide biosynthesis protein [Amphritea sp. 1_MG-2023]